MTDFPHLFQPLTLRGRRFKNRLILAPHGTGMSEQGSVGDKGLAYYRARIANGIAGLVTEAHSVTPLHDDPYPTLTASDDSCLPGLTRLADLAHDHDCRLIGQIYHQGRARGHSLDGSLDVAVAPSSLPDERWHIVPYALGTKEVEQMVGHFASAAGRMKRAGCDGVEVLVGMGYLHAQFLSPRTNIRTDKYGGSAENRQRFLRETLTAMREEVGEDMIIGFRIVPEDDDPDGLRLEDSQPVCQAMALEGLTDYISVAVGGTHTLAGTSLIVPPMFVDHQGPFRMARAVREVAPDMPVLVTGRINQPQIAEQAVSSGLADLVGMVRAFLSDPAFVRKAQEGRAEEIRACIGCNQACIGHRNMGFSVSCIQRPESGRETLYAAPEPAQAPKSVLVIGGGPGGMKAAITAAARGHRVSLHERSDRLGGQALLAQALPGRAEFGGLVTNLEGELARSRVEVHRNSNLDAGAVGHLAPDAVIVATGARPTLPQGAFEGAHMVTADDVIEGRANVGGRVLVADWRCDWTGMGLAEMLAANGCAVTLAVNGETAGQHLQPYLRYHWVTRLHRLGIAIRPYLRLHGADEDTVYMAQIVGGDAVMVEDIDTLVVAGHRAPETSLVTALSETGMDVRAIGDCLSPRTAEEAIFEGLKAGLAV